MIRQLLCGCCSNGCMCPTHAANQKSVVCLSHRAAALRHVSLGQYKMLSDEQRKSGQFMIDLEIENSSDLDVREAVHNQRDSDEERDGTYR